MILHLWPLDLGLRPLGAHLDEAYGEKLCIVCIGSYEAKYEIIIWGTWDSNPSPKGLCLHALTNPTALFN